MSKKAQVDVTLNGEEAKARLKEIGEELKKLKALKDKFLEEGNASGVATVNREMKQLNNESAKLRKNVVDVNNTLKNLSSASIQELNAALRVATREMNALKRSDSGFAEKQKQVTQLKNEIDKATSKAREHNTSMSKLADGFNRYFGMATAAIASFTGVILGFRKAADEFDQFEKRGDVLSSLTGLVGEDLAYLTEEAKKLSVATLEGGVRITEGADKILDAYTKVGSARPELLKNKEDLNAVTKEAMILAAAADTELQPAVESLTGVLNQFNYPASETRRIINTIAAGSKEGAGEIPYLTEAIEKSGTVAKDAGIEIEELVGIIETMAPRMSSPEMAGRSLRGVILKLQQGANETNPAIVGFSKALENLAAKNLSAAEMVDLFGLENITAAKILMNNREEMNKYTDAVTGTNVALEQAAINTDNNIAKKQQARNELKLVTMQLGEKLSPAIIVSTNGFTYLVKGIMASVQVFKEHRGIILSSIAGILTYTTAVYGVTAAKKIYTVVVNVATAATRAFNTTVKTSPLGWIAGAIAFAVTAFITFRNEVKKASKEQEVFNDVQKEINKNIVNEVGEMDRLFNTLKNSNLQSQQRRDLINEINKKYGEYLPQLLTEKSSLFEIEQAYQAANNQLRNKIELMVKESKAKEIYLQAFEKEQEYERVAKMTAAEYNKENNIVEGVRGAARSRFLNNLKKEINEIYLIYDNLLNQINGGVNLVGPLNYDYNAKPKTDDDTTPPGYTDKGALTRDLQIKERLQKSEIELMKDGYDKRLATIKSSYESEKKQIELDLKTNKELTASQRKDLNEILKNLDSQYLKNQEDLKKEWSLKSLNFEKDAIQLKLNSVRQGTQEEFELKKELLQKNLEIEIASLEGTEEQKAEKKELLSKKYAFELSNLEIDQSKHFLDDQLREEIQTLTDNHRKKLELLKKQYDDGKISLKEYNKERKKIEQEYSNESLEIAIKKAERELEIIKASGEDITQAEAALAAMRLKLQEGNSNTGKKESEGSDWEDWSDQERVNFALDSAQQLADAEFRIAQEKNQRELDDKLGKLDEQREKELSNKKLTEEQKEAINKKYDAKAKALQKAAWDKQHKADLASAWINMALSIGRAANNSWPVPAIPMMAAAAIVGGLQIAQIAKQKNPYKFGGFTDRSVSDDTEVGSVHANEFVANAQATRNPSVRRVLNVIDYAQKTGTIRSINLPAILDASNKERMYKSGGYTTSNTGAGVAIEMQKQDNSEFINAVNLFKATVDELKRDGIKADAKLVYQDFKEMKEKEDLLIAKTA